MIKRILFAVFAVLISSTIIAQTWTPPGNYQPDSRRSSQRALHVGETFHAPAGAQPALGTNGYSGAGALFTDSVSQAFYYYVGGLFRNLSEANCNGFIEVPQVVFTGTPRRFAITSSRYNIDCIRYNADTATVQVGTGNSLARYDVIYADTAGYHITVGDTSETPSIPTLSAGQLFITAVFIPAFDSLSTGISSVIIYDEGSESNLTNSGTTTTATSTVAPWTGTYHTRVTNINNGDYYEYTIPSGTWDITSANALAFFIKNRAQMPQLANVRVSLWVGNTQVSANEVTVGLDKNNNGGWQPVSIDISAFGTIVNKLITKVRFRYTSNNGNNFTGNDLDYIHFITGLAPPAQSGGVNSVDITINGNALGISGTNTGNVTKSFLWGGSSTQLVAGNGTLITNNYFNAIGTFNSLASDARGANISGNTIAFQPVGANPGMTTPAMKAAWDSANARTVENLGGHDTVAVFIDGLRTGFKSFKDSTGIGIVDRGDYLAFYSTTGGANRFGVAGEDESADDYRVFDLTDNDFQLIDGDNDNGVTFYGSQSNIAIDVANFANSLAARFRGFHESSTDGVINAIRETTSQANTVAIAEFGRWTTGAPRNNSGGAIKMMLRRGSDTAISNQMKWVVTDSVDASYDTKLILTGIADGTEEDWLMLDKSYAYFKTDTLATRAYARSVGGGGGGGADGNFAEDNLTFDADRSHALAGNSLGIYQGANAFLEIDPTANAEQALLRAYNTTGSDNFAKAQMNTSDTEAEVLLQGVFNGGAKEFSISGSVNTGSSTIGLSADEITNTAGTITFNGSVIFDGTTDWGIDDVLSVGQSIDGVDRVINAINSGEVSMIARETLVSPYGAEVNAISGVGTSRIILKVDNADGEFSLRMGVDGSFEIADDRTGTPALQYAADYAAGFTDRSIIDRGYYLNFEANRTVNLAGSSLQIQDGGVDYLLLNPATGAAEIKAFNNTDNGNQAQFHGEAESTQASFRVEADFNDGVKNASISGDVNATEAVIEYFADDNIFTGNILTATDNTYDIGDATNSFKDGYFRSFIMDGATSGAITLVPAATAGTNTITLPASTGTAALTKDHYKRIFWVAPASSTTITTVGVNAYTSSGTISTPTPTTTNLLTSTRRTSLSTGASPGTSARVSNTSLEVWRGNAAGLGGFKEVFRWGLNTTQTGNRVFVGLVSTTSSLTNVDHFTNTAIDRVGCYIDATTGNWYLIHNTSGSAATSIDLGSNFAVNTTDLLELILEAAPNASTISYTVNNLSTGNTTSGTLSSNLPTATNWLAQQTWCNNNAQSAAVIVDMVKMYSETNY